MPRLKKGYGSKRATVKGLRTGCHMKLQHGLQEPQVELEDKQLLPAAAAKLALTDGTGGKEPEAVANVAAAQEGLQKFVDSMHQKAASLTSWMTMLEPPSNPKPSERAVRSSVSRSRYLF